MAKTTFVATQEQVDKLLAEIEKLGIPTPKRQHGRKGTTMENMEDELTRRYHNLHSIIYRAKKKKLYNKPSVDETSNDVLNEAGITQVDIRRFKGCFMWEPSMHILPSIEYVRNMTGLNDYQILVLEDYLQMKVQHNQLAE